MNEIAKDTKNIVATTNIIWAQNILALLKEYGVDELCIAPGSRSTPLVIGALNQNNFNLHTHFDERGLGFFALGLAKASKKPVALIVTSGTAVANLLPAVVEANLTGERLILLTADRPKRLINCGANQAIDQNEIFSNHVCDAINLSSPQSDQESIDNLLDLIANSLKKQIQNPSPLHINCPFEEPLYGTEAQSSVILDKNYFSKMTLSKLIPNEQDKADFYELIEQKGIIITGQLTIDDYQKVIQLNKILKWPLFTDPQSCGSSEDWANYDLWLQNKELNTALSQATTIIQFGARLVSKRLNQLIENNDWKHYWLIHSQNKNLDPTTKVTRKIKSKPADFISSLPVFNNPENKNWAKFLTPSINKVQKTISDFVATRKDADLIDEISFSDQLPNFIDNNMDLFLGNSLMVRMINMFSKIPTNTVFTNRGASGIDGLLATALGAQRTRKLPMICVLGDLSLLHDLNSLALAKSVKDTFILIVCNNKGGAIFDILPVNVDAKNDFYRLSHDLDFYNTAKMFDLQYSAIYETNELSKAIINAKKIKSATIIELCINSNKAISQLKEISNNIANKQFHL